MKIAKIVLENFKRFDSIEIDLRNAATKELAEQFLILGDNGSGKTTILQAIGLCLSMVSGKIRNVDAFDWQGWVPGRYDQWGRPRIELEVFFDEDEIIATREIALKWIQEFDPHSSTLPSENSRMVLRLKGDWAEAEGEDGSTSNAHLYQLKGRMYAAQLVKRYPQVRGFFRRLPGFFWFDQYRNLGSTPSGAVGSGVSDPDVKNQNVGSIGAGLGIARYRKYLNTWKLNQLTKNTGETDWLSELESSFRKIFPGRHFHSIEPMHQEGFATPEDYYFTLSDGQKNYDIEEMSAGEQSVFPILFDFVRQQIRKSVVLVDEIDLNLHPPLAQSLVNTLLSLGPGCQFILTTHSQAIVEVMSPEEVFRLPGGVLCL